MRLVGYPILLITRPQEYPLYHAGLSIATNECFIVHVWVSLPFTICRVCVLIFFFHDIPVKETVNCPSCCLAHQRLQLLLLHVGHLSEVLCLKH